MTVIFGNVSRATRGFTLVELLVVMAIIGVLASLILPGFLNTLSSTNLTAGANSLAGELDLARQTASTRGVSVAVRLYQDASETLDNNGNHPYRLVAIVIPAAASGAASDEFLGRPQSLNGDVIVDSNLQQSSVLDVGLGATGLQPVAGTEQTAAPYALRNLHYVQFVVLADGTINLDPTQSWCLTLFNGNKSHVATANGGPAANFITFVLDVQTGRTRTYQP